ncbi:MAG TPA: hypothetical protein VGP72_23450 [Planctomycetota bacterium]|jgi:hypothetical protein
MPARDKPSEKEAVRTTIVGGRPPGCGTEIGTVPRGIEILIKKASVDPDFKRRLLESRAEAAGVIGLKLEPSEALMLGAVPAAQLEAIIGGTKVSELERSAFLGAAAALMLAALTGCGQEKSPPVAGIAPGRTLGISPDRPDVKPVKPAEPNTPPKEVAPTDGIRPDRPPVPANQAPTDMAGARPIRPETAPPVPKVEEKAEISPELRKRFDELVAELESPEFERREKATGELIKLGKPILPLLDAARTMRPEVANRIRIIRLSLSESLDLGRPVMLGIRPDRLNEALARKK